MSPIMFLIECLNIIILLQGHSMTRKLNSDGKVDTMQTLHNLNEGIQTVSCLLYASFLKKKKKSSFV